MDARDIAAELERHIGKLGSPSGDTPSVMRAAADEIRRLQAYVDRLNSALNRLHDVGDQRDQWLDAFRDATASRDELHGRLVEAASERDKAYRESGRAECERDLARAEAERLRSELACYRPAGWLMTAPGCDGSADWYEPGTSAPAPEARHIPVQLYMRCKA